MLRSHTVMLVAAALVALPQHRAQAQQPARWVEARCDIKPGHYLVNSGLLYLRSAANTRFADQRQKDLGDAHRVLTQALTTGGQDKNPAAWYYLGRYYLMLDDPAGADSAFRQTAALKAECQEDINTWRRVMWVPIVNAGVAAWQANNTDSAMAAFRRANAILQTDPQSFKYLASLLYNSGQQDSAALYFRKTADIAAADPKFAQDRRDALFNLGRILHSMQRWADAEATYREYLTLYPNDAEIMASLGAVQLQQGKRDSAMAVYRRIVAMGDSVDAIPLFKAGVEIFQGAPPQPDTAAAAASCRTEARADRLTPARIRARCDSVKTNLMREHATMAQSTYRLAAQAFEAGLKTNPYYRDGLFNLVNTYLTLGDSARMLAAAQRLVSVDPLSRQSLRLLAFAHQQRGQVDSTIHYLRVGDSLLVADVAVSEFATDSQSATVRALVTNPRTTRNQPFKLVFEFLDKAGQPVATQTAEIPAIEPGQGHAVELQASGAGIVAWRYRKEG